MAVSHLQNTSPQFIVSGGIFFSTVVLPAGTANYSITSNVSQVVCPSTEALSSVNWTLPKASTCPGLQMSLVNKSTSATVNVLTTDSDYLPSYFSPAQLPPSAGPTNDQFYYFESDGVDTWQ
jgi:hypothetical protein